MHIIREDPANDGFLSSEPLPPGSGIVLAMIAGGLFWGVVLTLVGWMWR
jgi:hypothetical protein